MKKFKIKNLIVITALTVLGLFSFNVSIAEDGRCWRKETGYIKDINGYGLCVLDNASRECYAYIDRCKVQ